MSGVCRKPILNNQPVSKRKRGNDYVAPKSTELPEASKEDATMAGQGATTEQIAISLRCKDTAKQNMIKQKELERKAEKEKGKSVKITELLTEMGIQINQIKVKLNKMERVKLDHTTVVEGFKECDG